MTVQPFYSVNETKKSIDRRRYHNNNKCPSGYDIPQNERKSGTGGYTLCQHCKDLNAKARKR